MFCQIKTYAKCHNISKIQSSLVDTEDGAENWLNECQVCLSLCGNLLVIAKGNKLAILNTQWDNTINANAFMETWTGTLTADITALFTLQVSNGDSNEIGNDWLCIIVGFKTGEIGFYSDQGKLLILDKYDDMPVLKIKCFTGLHNSDTDEINIIYSNSVCCLAVSNLLQTLRYARLKVAKVHAKSTGEGLMEGHNLLTRKLGLVSQEVICDASVIGLELSNTFDHLLTASIHGGFYTGYRSVAPLNTVVIGTGARPYLGFHQALEGGTVQPILNDVARAVASKIKSALPGWLGGKTNSETPTAPPPASDRMVCRYAITDLHRKGVHCTTSPDRRLLAVTDTLGRVVLMDVRRGVAVRMFKGYRNSQCGFLQVKEDSSKRKTFGRKILFLVLYVGKLGLLEVWPLRGPRITAFSTAINGRLLYYPHNVNYQGNRRSSSSKTSALSLLLPDGEIKQISIPFHFALNSEDSERSRDVHIVKRLRQILKDKESDNETIRNEFTKTVQELKTIEMKLNCMETLSSNKNIQPELLLICINTLKMTMPSQDDQPNQDVLKLNIIFDNLYALIKLFSFTNDIKLIDDLIVEETEPIPEEVIKSDDENNQDNDENIISEETQSKIDVFTILTEIEINNLLHLLNLAASTELKRAQHAKVTFVDDKKSSFSEFISGFNINSDSEMLTVKDSMTKELSLFISSRIFDCFISGETEWLNYEKQCANIKKLSPIQLRNFLLTFWNSLSVQEITKSKMEKFAKVMYDLCCLEGLDNIYGAYNETSSWWQDVRDFLVESSCPFKGMVSAQLCRAVARKVEREVENEPDEDMWERFSRDGAQWGLLVGKLDDISLLSIILSQKPELQKKLPLLQIEMPEVSLKYIYFNGKGSISELAAIWLCIAGVDPQDIVKSDEQNPETEDNTSNTSNVVSVRFDMDEKNTSKINVMTLFDKLDLLKKQFPFSLSSHSIVVSMCWEYAKYWSKNIEEVSYLEALLKCLQAVQFTPLKRGICAMIWSTYLRIPFETSYKLISKVGKLPREKLTRQNIGISDVQLLKILELLSEFLDLFLISALINTEDETFALKYEEMWDESRPALIELALSKCDVNVEVLQMHYELSAAIYYQCFLGSNYWKHLVNLYDVESQQYMFGLLNNNSGPTMQHQMADSRVIVQRENFLVRLVNKCVELPKDRGVWIDRIQDLCRLWRVRDDLVRKEYLLRLYAQGMEVEAEEMTSVITDFRSILEDLIPIAARRLKYFVYCTEHTSEKIASLSPRVTNYLESVEEASNEVVAGASLEWTIRILQASLAHTERRKDNPAYSIGTMLFDACKKIHELMLRLN